MKHPTKEELIPLLNAIDNYIYAKVSRKNIRKKYEELEIIYQDWLIKMDDSIIVCSEDIRINKWIIFM